MKKVIEVPSNLANDILWGVGEIAAHIKRTRAQTYYLIAKGVIPADKLGAKTIVGRKSKINRALAGVGDDDVA